MLGWYHDCIPHVVSLFTFWAAWNLYASLSGTSWYTYWHKQIHASHLTIAWNRVLKCGWILAIMYIIFIIPICYKCHDICDVKMYTIWYMKVYRDYNFRDILPPQVHQICTQSKWEWHFALWHNRWTNVFRWRHGGFLVMWPKAN